MPKKMGMPYKSNYLAAHEADCEVWSHLVTDNSSVGERGFAMKVVAIWAVNQTATRVGLALCEVVSDQQDPWASPLLLTSVPCLHRVAMVMGGGFQTTSCYTDEQWLPVYLPEDSTQ